MRARKPDDKLSRRHAVVEAATRELVRDRHRLANVTMTRVAATCGLAKGTLYLYFCSKDELFLAVLEHQLGSWLDALEGELVEKDVLDAQLFAEIAVRTLSERESLTELLPFLQTLLEGSVEVQTSDMFRATMHGRLQALACLVEAKLRLEPTEGMRVMVRMLALMIGLRNIPIPAVGIADAEAKAALREHAAVELRESLKAVVEALCGHKHTRRRAPLSSEHAQPELEPAGAT
jgi:AcrR family transcriptional regulator